jgi:hypothetical protein
MVGDTNMENCTRPYHHHHHHQNKTCNIRKREKRTIKTHHPLSIKILQYLFLHKFVAQEEDSFITSRTEERDKEREKIKKPCVGVFIALSCSLILFSSSSSSW